MTRRTGPSREVGGVKVYKRWSEWEENDTIEGIYGGKGHDATYDKPNYLIRLAYSEFTSGRKYKEGELFCMNSNGGLDLRMQDIQIGEYVRVTYTGRTPLPKGHKFAGKDSIQLLVEVIGDDAAPVDNSEDLDGI